MSLRLAAAAVAAVAAGVLPASGGAVPPVITVEVTSGTAGANGWWVSNINVQFHISGTFDTVTGCAPAALTTEGTHQLSCSVTGSDGPASLDPIFRIDKTPPSVDGGTPSRGPDANGWYRSALSVSFSGSDATSGIASCSSGGYAGPDTVGTSIGGTCTDRAGLTGSGSFGLKYDSTPPAVTAAPERKPDANGWYNHPVKLTAEGSDAVSGVGACSSPTYSGPDAAAASITATCTDAAGNSASTAVAIRYDATAPKLGAVKATFGNRRVTLTWTTADARSVVVRRRAGAKGAEQTVYSGTGRTFTDRGLTNGRRYRYAVRASDQAGNTTTASTLVVPRALFAPLDGQRVTGPPRLRWAAVAKAGYYNVQLFRGRRKVLSIWPARTTLQLQRSWTYLGDRFRLAPGLYRWYVFPGFGARAANRYGALLGGSTFRVVR